MNCVFIKGILDGVENLKMLSDILNSSTKSCFKNGFIIYLPYGLVVPSLPHKLSAFTLAHFEDGGKVTFYLHCHAQENDHAEKPVWGMKNSLTVLSEDLGLTILPGLLSFTTTVQA